MAGRLVRARHVLNNCDVLWTRDEPGKAGIHFMTATTPRIRALLRQATKTENAGKKKAAEQLYRQILDEAPETVPAWLGLARVVNNETDRQDALERVLTLEPENEEAREGLDLPPAEAEVGRPSVDSIDAAPVDNGEPVPDAIPEHDVALTYDRSDDLADEADKAGAGVEVFTCFRHPESETTLRCYNCSRPICMKCANRTPVGYMCPICVYEAEDAFFSATALDYLSAAIVAFALGLIGGIIARFIGFFVIFVAAGGGALIGRLSFRAARRHRGRYLPHLVAAMVVLGAVIPSLGTIVFVLTNPGAFLALLWPAVYLLLAPAAAFWQVK